MEEFLDKILKTLSDSGFPAKRVSLPTEKMYEAADNRGLSFNTVIEELRQRHGIDATVGADKIIFSTLQKPQEDLLKEAQEMMSKMDPAELRKLQEMFMNMSAEERAEIMKKGKDLGLI